MMRYSICCPTALAYWRTFLEDEINGRSSEIRCQTANLRHTGCSLVLFSGRYHSQLLHFVIIAALQWVIVNFVDVLSFVHELDWPGHVGCIFNHRRENRICSNAEFSKSRHDNLFHWRAIVHRLRVAKNQRSDVNPDIFSSWRVISLRCGQRRETLVETYEEQFSIDLLLQCPLRPCEFFSVMSLEIAYQSTIVQNHSVAHSHYAGHGLHYYNSL